MAVDWVQGKYIQAERFHMPAVGRIMRKAATTGGLVLGTCLLLAAHGCFKTFDGGAKPPQKQPLPPKQSDIAVVQVQVPKAQLPQKTPLKPVPQAVAKPSPIQPVAIKPQAVPPVAMKPQAVAAATPAPKVEHIQKTPPKPVELPVKKPLEPPLEPPVVFDFQNVVNEAHKLAGKPFQLPKAVPEFLQRLNYDQWRDIRFKPDHALWAGDKLNFTVQFFHTGFFYNYPVGINVVDHRGAHEYKFSPEMFDYGKNNFKGEKLENNRGFAGFRIHYPLNTGDYYDEIAVFLGASYFRAVAQNQFYGLSMRGLAVDTAANTGEEFPFFREFWLLRPTRRSREITVMALLDSKSITGAYQYVIKPGKENIFEVKSALFPRRKVAKLGIAPMTSMFFYGEHSYRHTGGDFRPEVHDSDGLYFESGSENVWRPLVNPEKLFINSFQANGLFKGFGLLQRDTDFNNYLDLETRSEKRPSLWLTPGKDWPKGHIELVQIPSPNEIQDNMVAMWLVKDVPAPGSQLNVSYNLKWCSPQPDKEAYGYTAATRKMNIKPDGSVKFVLDFQGGPLSKLKSVEGITANINVDGEFALRECQITKNEITGGFRLVFVINHKNNLINMIRQDFPAVEIRAYLNNKGKRITEIWSYALVP